MNRASILARKLTRLHTRMEILLDFEPQYYQAYAGLMIYYDSLNYIMLRKAYEENDDTPVLDLLRVHNGERLYLPGSQLAVARGRVLRLCVAVDGRQTQFGWGYEDGETRHIGPVFDTSEFSDEYCKSGEFTGTFLGFGCVDALLHRATADIKEQR